MLRLLTGRNQMLAAALLREIGAALPRDERALYIVVPRQLTLETELLLINGLELEGSFRLRVLSPERLCALIFDAAGAPEGMRVDERGRALLLSGALKELKDELTLYRGARARRGFVVRAAKQVEAFRQAGLSPEDLLSAADRAGGALKWKLSDLSQILGAYTAALEGRFQDGEAEFRAAAERAENAAFLEGSALWFYGFDLMPPTLHALIAALAARTEVSVLLPLEGNERAADYDLFRPLDASMRRLVVAARGRNAAVERRPLAMEDARAEELQFLGRELFAYPAHPRAGAPRNVQLLEARNPREEARFAAALVRRLVRTRNWRYDDVRVLLPSLDSYREPLREAFAAAGIPIFLSEARPASRHALAECLLTALSLLARGYQQDDVLAYLSAGYHDLAPDEVDRLKNYAVQYGLRSRAFLEPLKRGRPALIEALEPLRRQAMAPIAALRDRLREASNLRAQLEAIYAFLEDIGAYERGLLRQKRLAEAELYEQAGEEAQVWNRLLGALDQMEALLPPAKLSLSEIADRLSESLEAAMVKPLPQSGDAVYAHDLTRLSMRRAKAVLVLGQVDRAASAPEGLLTDRQLESLSRAAERYVGQTAADAARSRLFYIKAGIEMATDYVLISHPLSGIDGAAERPGILVSQIRQIFPDVRVRGGVAEDAGADALRFEAPGAALRSLALSLSEGLPTDAEKRMLSALSAIPEMRAALEKLSGALNLRAAVDRLRPETAREIYQGLKRASVSRLEAFAACPFRHFMRYGIGPVVIEPYALSPRDEGVFFHDAVRGFMARAMDGDGFDPALAEARMDGIAEVLLAPLRQGPLGQSAVALAEEKRLRGVARTAARLIAEQLEGSQFRPVGVELRFGEAGAELRVGRGEDCALYGMIDRVDEWDGPEKYLRILDYKRGARAFDPAEAYAGLQLQLLVYLAAAARKRGGTPVGAFYFRLDEGYILTQEVDPAKVEAERLNALRMDGILPEDATLREAMSPQCERYFKTRGLSADTAALARMTDHALKMAGQHADAIRAGDAAPAPARAGKKTACEHCDWARACLFDPSLDRDRVRDLSVDKKRALELLAGVDNVTID